MSVKRARQRRPSPPEQPVPLCRPRRSRSRRQRPVSTSLCSSMASTSTPGAGHTIVSYSWTFGDGGTATGVTASHAYLTAGTYSAQLKVTDEIGQSATSAIRRSPSARRSGRQPGSRSRRRSRLSTRSWCFQRLVQRLPRARRSLTISGTSATIQTVLRSPELYRPRAIRALPTRTSRTSTRGTAPSRSTSWCVTAPVE